VLDRFVFAGFRQDIHRLMLAADMSVLCTHFEGLPLVLIEAMAAECPCVATAVDGIPESVSDGVTGLLHDHEDAEGLAAAIARLADAPHLAHRMGANARAEAERRFSQDRFARDALALYARFGRSRRASAHPLAKGNAVLAHGPQD
jgi:glycosyltransferase involved in cell wall biosynthesis